MRGKDAARASDLLGRSFTMDRPDKAWVTDFTYVRTHAGFVYVAMVTDLYARRILSWHASILKDTAFVEEALTIATWQRKTEGRALRVGPSLGTDERVIHHCDAGSQYTAIRYTETVDLEGLRPSIGRVGDAYDNAVPETVFGLYKNEAIRPDSPFRTGPLQSITDVEQLTAEWVTWYNTARLHSNLDYQTPTEVENNYYENSTQTRVATSKTKTAQNPGRFTVSESVVCGCK